MWLESSLSSHHRRVLRCAGMSCLRCCKGGGELDLDSEVEPDSDFEKHSSIEIDEDVSARGRSDSQC